MHPFSTAVNYLGSRGALIRVSRLVKYRTNYSCISAWACRRPLLAIAAGILIGCVAVDSGAAPTTGPALDLRFLRPEPEPLGPSSRRSGVVISEVMYHPRSRADNRNLQFVEIYNSLPWFEEIGGWQLSGEVEFVFPEGFVLPSLGFVVVAADPSALKQFAGVTNVLGPFAGGKSLSKSNGRLQLRNRMGAVDFDLQYETTDPWPIAPDGAGHSLVLARPSYGEGDPRAWSASKNAGGSPRAYEPARDTALLSVFINEVLASPTAGQEEFVELFNYSDRTVDVSGCVLTDDLDLHSFAFAPGTVMQPRGFLTLTSAQLGFGLSAKGDKLFFMRPGLTGAIDAVRYDGQSLGVSLGRYPDAAPGFRRLSRPTMGGLNALPSRSPVVINEIMFHPASDQDNEEFVELHNASDASVDIAGWRFDDGIKFTFPSGTVVPAGGYVVLASDPVVLAGIHPEIPRKTIFGPFEGGLRNGGERITLAKPEAGTRINKSAIATFSEWLAPVDVLTYGRGGRWGRWTDGGGSSLELRNPASDFTLAPNWLDSDETASSGWTTVEVTGKVDFSNGAADSIEVLLYGAGECLLDDVEVISVGNTNRLANGTFETGTNGWTFQGNHSYTRLETNGGFQSLNSLRLSATGAGHTGPNRLRAPLRATVPNSQNATLRAKVRWLTGSGQMLLRLHGNGVEAPGSLLTTLALGTPGRRNSRFTTSTPPAITEVLHYPVLPRSAAPVTVVARVSDWDGIASVRLLWRRDPATNITEIAMVDNGAGLFSAEIPGQATNVLVAFSIAASDQVSPGVSSVFPDNAPTRECLVRWGETSPISGLGAYHLWGTKATMDRWTKREKLSNDPLDTTFIYGDFRAIYNTGAQYSGSPYHAPSYSSPTTGNCDYVYVFPSDDAFLGDSEISLLQPGNGGGDTTGQHEHHAYWIARELGLPFCHRRSVFVYVNGTRRGVTYDDSQQPNSDFVKQWFPDDPDGDLHKIQLWFEFDAAGSSFTPVGADLNNYTSNGRKKLGRYRWNWPRRAAGIHLNNFTNLFSLVDACNTNGTGAPYVQALQKIVDVDQWYRTDVVEHIVNNNDSFSYGGGQNMYAYKPIHGPWKLLIWDIDFAFNDASTTGDLFNIGGREHGPVNTEPVFRRRYFQALLAAAAGPLSPERSSPILEARYQGMRTNGASVTSAAAMKTFVTKRRDYILSQYARNDAPLRVKTNDGDSFDSLDSVVTLTGTAPLSFNTITLNGAFIDVKWSNLTNWSYAVTLAPGVNKLELSGVDQSGLRGTNAVVSFAVNFRSNRIAPPPDILDVSRQTSTISLRWRAVPGGKYRVESSPTLVLPRWTSTDVSVPSGVYKGFYSASTSATDTQFFRVRLLP